VKIMATKNIGINVTPPEAECQDPNCPFHGSLSVRGQTLDGKVVSISTGTAIVERKYMKYQQKYERYEKRSKKYPAHLPACMKLEPGDDVTIMECRPLSKTVSFVILGKRD
jgi:small subunit ribosomal protein S17